MAISLVKAGFQSGTGCRVSRRRRLRESLNSLLGASRETNSEPFQFFCIIPLATFSKWKANSSQLLVPSNTSGRTSGREEGGVRIPSAAAFGSSLPGRSQRRWTAVLSDFIRRPYRLRITVYSNFRTDGQYAKRSRVKTFCACAQMA